MKKQDPNTSLVAEFLNKHRFQPPERDGWYNIKAIQDGIKNELSAKIGTIGVALALDFLHERVEPPAVEDGWFEIYDDGTFDPEHNMSLEDVTDPDRDRSGRAPLRMYRALGSAANHVKIEYNQTEIYAPGLLPDMG